MTLWTVVAGGLAAVTVGGARALAAAGQAALLCRISAALERELGEAREVRWPPADNSSEWLLLIDSAGRKVRYQVSGEKLTARSEGLPERVVAAGCDLAVFHVREGRPRIVRTLVSAGGPCVLTSCWVGAAPRAVGPVQKAGES